MHKFVVLRGPSQFVLEPIGWKHNYMKGETFPMPINSDRIVYKHMHWTFAGHLHESYRLT